MKYDWQLGVRTVYLNEAHSDYFAQDKVALLMEHRFPAIEQKGLEGYGLPGRRFAAQVILSRQNISDSSVDIVKFAAETLSRQLDRCLQGGGFRAPALPAFEPFPRWERLKRNVRGALSSKTPAR